MRVLNESEMLRTYRCTSGNTDGSLLSSDGLRLAKAGIGSLITMDSQVCKLREKGAHLNLNGSVTFLANQLSSTSAVEIGFEFELSGADIMINNEEPRATQGCYFYSQAAFGQQEISQGSARLSG
jgi:hypothetical protein